MRNKGSIYTISCLQYFFLAVLALSLLSGCMQDKAQQEAIKWRVTLDKEDKRPYGTYLAFQSLKYYFPDAALTPLSRGFRYSNMDNRMKYSSEGHALLILEGLDFYVSDQEWKDLKDFIKNGNEVVLFCSVLDSKIEQELYCYKRGRDQEDLPHNEFVPEHDNQNILSISNDTAKQYGYEGRTLKGYFSFPHDSTATDSSNGSTALFPPYPDTLGYANGQPDFIRYKLGEGHLTLHGAPLTLSNYFLLQDGNEQYLTALWRTLPNDINRVYWNDYFKRNGEASGLDVLLRYPATRWALILAVIVLVMYLLFEGKRKQRIIPIIAPIKNDSVSFVETVGRLYYNKGNHTNLAEKMTQQFLEWVRTHYFLNTNLINETFIQQLTLKSGQPEATVRGLVDMIHEIRLGGTKLNDAYLYQLYRTIQQFYKNQYQ